MWPAFLTRAYDNGISPACTSYDPAVFFPGPGASSALAKAVCGSCPLCAACRGWALSQPRYQLYGIWGGTTRQERIDGVTGAESDRRPVVADIPEDQKERST